MAPTGFLILAPRFSRDARPVTAATLPDLPTLVLGASAGLLGTAGALWAYRRHRNDPDRRIVRALRHMATDWLRDVVLPDGIGGEIQLDYVARLPDRILVLDVRHLRGTVFGGVQIDEWTHFSKQSTLRFRNPLYDHRVRVHAVSALIPGIPVSGRVVFSDETTFPRGMPEGVSLLAHLREDIDPKTPAAELVPGLDAAWARIKALGHTPD